MKVGLEIVLVTYCRRRCPMADPEVGEEEAEGGDHHLLPDLEVGHSSKENLARNLKY